MHARGSTGSRDEREKLRIQHPRHGTGVARRRNTKKESVIKTRRIVGGFGLIAAGALVLILGLTLPAQGQQEWLIDLGTTSPPDFRSAPVVNPDNKGHYWNSVGSFQYWPSLKDSDGNVTSLALGFDYVNGDDSYNGPAGITFNPSNSVFDAVALGDLGVGAAVFDYYVNSKFELQGLNPGLRYNLTFFGSHAYSTDNTTVYSLYTDNGYSNVVASIGLNVQIPGNSGQWNTNQVAILNNVSPQNNGVMYIGFVGEQGNLGYLNAMEIQVVPAVISNSASAARGATVPWTTYEAENMTNNGTLLGPSYTGNNVASEASGRQCVRLSSNGAFVQFIAVSNANAIVVRYSVPDTSNGVGADYTISLYTNDAFYCRLPVTSKYSWLYGAYPFANTTNSGSPRNFYDEVRTNGLSIAAGMRVKLQKDSTYDTASYYDIDLVDLENVPAAISQPGGSVSIKSAPYNAVGDGSNDDTSALQSCINGNSSVWLPPGNFKITASINLPSNRTIQGAGMWYTTLVGDPTLYTTSSRRVTLNGNGNNIHLSDLAIVGKLNYRNDSEPNDGLGGTYGTGSTISNIWVEHTKTGAWIVNSQGLVVNGCRFRNTIADGINLCVGMRSSTVTNCMARGTGDDCFPIWPATYTTQSFFPGFNVITHCTGQVPFLANGGAIYGGVSNTIQDCLFQDIPYGCGILISTTFPVGTNTIRGAVAQRCDLNRCGGFDPGYQWRAALQLCLDTYTNGILGVYLNNLNISNSVSDGMSIIGSTGPLTGALAVNVSIPNYGIGPSGRNALWARYDAIGSMTLSNCVVPEYKIDNTNYFSFIFVTTPIPITVQTSPSGLSFTADNTNYSTTHVFNWLPGSNHTIAVTSPQTNGTGTQYTWNSWSDSGPISHAVAPMTGTTYTATFTVTQYYLTMNAGAGGNVSPASGWFNVGTNISISAIASNGYSFSGWTGSGTGSYSGTNNPASVTMNGPVTQTANFDVLPEILGITIGGDGSLTISYATVPGYSYHVETTTNLSPAAWTTISGTTTNAIGNIIIFIDSNAVDDPQRFYRVVSP